MLMGGLGATAFWRRRHHVESLELDSDPAAELRARLDASKVAATDEPVIAASSEPAGAPADEAESLPTAAQAEAAPVDPVSLRAAIHARARGAIDDLR